MLYEMEWWLLTLYSSLFLQNTQRTYATITTAINTKITATITADIMTGRFITDEEGLLGGGVEGVVATTPEGRKESIYSTVKPVWD